MANGKASIYKVSYDEHFKAYTPGTLFTAMLMEHVIEKDKVTEVDCLIGDDPYKKNLDESSKGAMGHHCLQPANAVRDDGFMLGL
ncbi:MAG: hypothetical protein A3E79_13955 [Burkholderiales bacterium RIFCSPHIGHO2_12_FULL_61_11]|nr:MAG: hypothetical protein A3E79_13955 [Burkholderiales bacterium RIFCSPHIGHO2_12_FULL_61_11]